MCYFTKNEIFLEIYRNSRYNKHKPKEEKQHNDAILFVKCKKNFPGGKTKCLA